MLTAVLVFVYSGDVLFDGVTFTGNTTVGGANGRGALGIDYSSVFSHTWAARSTATPGAQAKFTVTGPPVLNGNVAQMMPISPARSMYRVRCRQLYVFRTADSGVGSMRAAMPQPRRATPFSSPRPSLARPSLPATFSFRKA